MGYTPPWLNVVDLSDTVKRLYFFTPPLKPYFEATVGGSVELFSSNAQGLMFYDQTGADFLKINWVTPDTQLTTFTNYNIALIPNGTGKVKFGTYTAGAATDSTGYITILDAAGNIRKLMVQA